MRDSLELVLEKLSELACNPRQSGGQYAARCPAHDDRKPSLSVTHDGEKVLLKCHTGCDVEDILEALGLTSRDLFDNDLEPEKQDTTPQITAIYDYKDLNGKLLYQKIRFHPKDFRIRRPDGRGGWIWNIGGTARVLYRLSELREGIRQRRRVFIVEGEKDVDRLIKMGQVATTNFEGAAKGNQSPKWRVSDYSQMLVGAREIIVVADNDEPGFAHARAVAASLRDVPGRTVSIVRAAVDTPHADVSNHLDAGHTLDELVPVADDDQAPEPPPADVWEQEQPTQLGAQPEPLPANVLGHIAAPMVGAVARSLQVPSDLALAMLLPVITTAARGRWVVQVGPDWFEPLILCTVAVANSGERKSPTNRALTAPLHAYEDEVRAEKSIGIAMHEARHKLLAAKVEKLRTKAVSGGQNDQLAYMEASRELADDVIENCPRWVTDDATPEAITKLLSEQGGAIGAISAEAGLFGILSGRYTSGNSKANLEVVLQATAGERILVDRKGAPPVRIPNPALSLGLAIQPQLLPDLAKGGFRDSGFLARFLWVLPEPRVGTRTTEEHPIPTETATLWNKHLVDLASTALQKSNPDDSGQQAPQDVLTLTPEARAELDRFRTELEPRLHPRRGDLAGIADWGSKLPGQVVKIAAALTLLADPAATEVQEYMMANAVRLGRGFIPHALATLAQIHDATGGTQPAMDVLSWLMQKKVKKFTVRQAHQGLRGRAWVKKSEDVQEALRVLEEFGHVRSVDEPQEKKGRPSKWYELHPSHLLP